MQIDIQEADKGFCTTCESNKEGTWTCVTLVPNRIIFVVQGYLTLPTLSSPFGSALNVDPWL